MISIHAPRVRCDNFEARKSICMPCISIHAPRVRCDTSRLSIVSRFIFYFNPRTSCEVRQYIPFLTNPCPFISIHAPRVRCDVLFVYLFNISIGISIHAPRVRCDKSADTVRSARDISIHAPRVRCDQVFLSHHYRRHQISIHAPRVRCDFRLRSTARIVLYFNPRTSCEVRRTISHTCVTNKKFQSTHLV